jgi:hypothetical protein
MESEDKRVRIHAHTIPAYPLARKSTEKSFAYYLKGAESPVVTIPAEEGAPQLDVWMIEKSTEDKNKNKNQDTKPKIALHWAPEQGKEEELIKTLLGHMGEKLPE